LTDALERRYETEARQPGEAHRIAMVNRWRAHWALARQWASYDAAVSAREQEIDELRQLLSRIAWELRRPDVNPQSVANRIERALNGR
jgi:hypothetical protein